MANKFGCSQIAELLKTSPEALKQFEEAYANIKPIEESDNLFSINSRDAAKLRAGDASKVCSELVEKIVNELLAQSEVLLFGYKTLNKEKLALPSVDPVSSEDILAIPSEMRPQLTGNLYTRDIPEDSSVLLWEYKEYLQAKAEGNKVRAKQMYNLFRQGLDILDLDPLIYAMLSRNPNSMGNWLPQLNAAVEKQDFFKIPKTKILKVPFTLLQLPRCDYMSLTETTMAIVDKYVKSVFGLDETKEYFIKTGTYSSKYDFRNAHVAGKEVNSLGEYLLFIHFQALQMASPLSHPTIYGVSTTNEWVVREYIADKENNPCIYEGMPLHTEYRVFVDFDTGEILGINPYWDPGLMKRRLGHSPDSGSSRNKHDYIIYKMHEDVLMQRYNENKDKVMENIQKLIPDISLTGQWSIDVMQNGDDFYIIDMALAANSALSGCVPKEKLKAVEENWLPRIKEMEQ